MRIGLDVGSTTLKCVALDEKGNIVYSDYQRHRARIRERMQTMLESAMEATGQRRARIALSGSAGMGLAERMGIPFVQEVYATRLALTHLLPGTDVAIELGGEDAKILFLHGENGGDGLEVRMNGTCAGGTGAFIDQMAALLGVPVEEIDALAAGHERIYPIASRCGVFAKSDVQPLINQGARREDVAASILMAVVNQTIAGLAQGRDIAGNIAYLGGPLTFLPQLRLLFDRALGSKGVCPENSLYFVAYGTALGASEEMDIAESAARLKEDMGQPYAQCAPLFKSEEEYRAFAARHAKTNMLSPEGADYAGRAYIGVDAGSTTIKAVALDEAGRILLQDYRSNEGSPVEHVKAFLSAFYAAYPRARVAGAAATGYGEELVKKAFRMDAGIVETMAHFTAARAFEPDVDFIIDIGGQDIKCFKIRGGAIDNIFLNEACSSGCGSFLQAFASAWDMSVEEFAVKGILADRPVDLGSRCTVFMNSSVKQAQKDGASLENISAGLSISVVKNALYKVIRTANASALGKKIVVQGGTFLNDAVLRAFELEIGQDVIRPAIAGLMGAYGAAKWVQEMNLPESTLLSPEELAAFAYTVRTSTCNGCANHCTLSINSFGGARRYISGNRCSRPLGGKPEDAPEDLYAEKRQMLAAYRPVPGKRGVRVGLPMGLNFYELLPFWHTLFTKLGFEVVTSGESTRETCARGQKTIPSDTVCYPAKLMHGHVEILRDMGVDAIFYPCMTYNMEEGKGDNHYNCPVVAYYAEVIKNNIRGDVRLINDYVAPHDERHFPRRMHAVLEREFGPIPFAEMREACRAAYAEYHSYMARVRERGQEILRKSRAAGVPVIVLVGRPYHVDAEICHEIDRLIGELGAAVITEDALCAEVPKFATNVLNQWTYHARLYSAAKYVAESGDAGLNLVQMVSFGCGVDAVTTDEVRAILERAGRIYTQVKIDEIANLGAVRIRLRSLFAAVGKEAARHGKPN